VDKIGLVYWDNNYNLVLLLNFVLVIAIFTSVRMFSGMTSHISALKELTEKDNPAFGVSMAGVVFAVTLVLSGAIYGDPIYTKQDSIISVGLYGVVGIILMAITRIIFNKIALPSVKIKQEIIGGNLAAGIIDAGNVIATAIIIRAMMLWVSANTVNGLMAVITGFIISQVLLTSTTLIRIKRFNKNRQNDNLQDELKSGNVAIALRFAGRKIGTAFAVAAASSRLVFELYDLPSLLGIWAGVSVIMIGLLTVLSFLATKVILAGINVEDEVIRQRNVALGAVQCVVYICLGILLSELMS
jgi:hypothetical protein